MVCRGRSSLKLTGKLGDEGRVVNSEEDFFCPVVSDEAEDMYLIFVSVVREDVVYEVTAGFSDVVFDDGLLHPESRLIF